MIIDTYVIGRQKYLFGKTVDGYCSTTGRLTTWGNLKDIT